MYAEEGPVAFNIVRDLHRQLKEKSIKLTQGFQLNPRICFPNPNFTGCFSLFLVLPGALATHMVQLIPGIQPWQQPEKQQHED